MCVRAVDRCIGVNDIHHFDDHTFSGVITAKMSRNSGPDQYRVRSTVSFTGTGELSDGSADFERCPPPSAGLGHNSAVRFLFGILVNE